jgi:hypothetical protein
VQQQQPKRKENGLPVYTFSMAEMKWNHNIKIQETHSTQKDPENCEK